MVEMVSPPMPRHHQPHLQLYPQNVPWTISIYQPPYLAHQMYHVQIATTDSEQTSAVDVLYPPLELYTS